MDRTRQLPQTDKPETFVEGPIDGVVLRPLSRHGDHRGWLTELFRDDELSRENLPAMGYASQTQPGVARGPHEHRHQSDYLVFLGPGDFTLYLWDTRTDSSSWGLRMNLVLGESNPQVVIVPPGVVHAYKNTGRQPAWVFNFPNRLYAGPGRQNPVDEIRHEDRPESRFPLD